MPISPRARIHPTAIVSSEAEISEDVEIGPFSIIEGRVQIGAGTILGPRVHLCGNLILGAGNKLFTGVVLGERPQHLGDAGEGTSTEIGDENIFRENVTVHRGTKAAQVTKIGNRNFFMSGSHVGHDSIVGNGCMFANNALIAGHCQIGDRAVISGNAAIHQFVRMGRLSMLSGISASTRDIPPFVLIYNRDEIGGVNVVGMKRAGLKTEEISAVRKGFKILYRQGMMLSRAVDQLELELGHYPIVQEMVQFIRESKRGVCGVHPSEKDRDAEAA